MHNVSTTGAAVTVIGIIIVLAGLLYVVSSFNA
jgi:uncharacterized membrane protein HdeD (DUF308 family)